MYEDPNVTEYAMTVVLRYASDEANAAMMAIALQDEVQRFAVRLGVDVEIHNEDLTTDGPPFTKGEAQ